MEIISNKQSNANSPFKIKREDKLEYGLAELWLLHFLVQSLLPARVPKSPPLSQCIHSRVMRLRDDDVQSLAIRMIRSNPTVETADLIASNLFEACQRLAEKQRYAAVVPFPMDEHRSGQELTNQISRALALKLGIPAHDLLESKAGKISERPAAEKFGLCKIDGQPVLLVSDLAQSKSRVDECRRVLSTRMIKARVMSWIGAEEDVSAAFP
jgi:hypothetical protein